MAQQTRLIWLIRHPELAKQLIAVDGKTIRGSGKTHPEQQDCVSAYAADAGLTLAVEFVQEKSNEPSGARETGAQATCSKGV